MCDREATTTRGCHLGYTDTLIFAQLTPIFSLPSANYLVVVAFHLSMERLLRNVGH